jgi:serine/threonine protein kinase/formylglycine-generating enzyme required for sulfatase activity
MNPSDTPPNDNDLDFAPTLRGLRKGWKVFERYTLARKLGQGGMGVVWLARDEKLDLDIALKFLPENLAGDDVAMEDLRAETRRCMRLTHENIVHVYGLESDEFRAAIAMEFVDGRSLSSARLEQPGKVFAVGALLPLVRQVCEALTYAHDRARIVHHDLKPANLMLTQGGVVKVMDFGIASSLSESMSRHSRAGQATGGGTLPYMSPQQLMGMPASTTDDVYALGATLYELLTGKPPFYRGSVEQQIHNVAPPSMAERRMELKIEGVEAVPPIWEQTIAACLEKEAEKRPRSVAEVWQRLSGEACGRPVSTPAAQPPVREPVSSPVSNPSSQIPHPSSPISRSRKLALAALVCVGGVLGWWYGYEQPRQERQRLDEMARQSGENRAMEVAALVTDGRKAYEAADYGTARSKLEAALTLESGHAEALRLLEQVKSAKQEEMPAVELAGKKSKAAGKKSKAAALVSEARSLFNGKDYEGAKQKISAALELVPGDSAAVNLKAEVQAAEEEQQQKTAPFSNSLGMKFVPAGTPGVLFSVWETRVKDFEAFVEDTGYDAISNSSNGAPAYTLEKTADGKGGEWAPKGGSWRDPRFPSKQTGEHPVVCVSYLDAEAFCAWLTKKDRAAGKIPATASYRLPTDAEWSRACGSGKYPWGESYPPKSSAGNYSGKEAMVGVYEGFTNPLAETGYRDSAARTAAVGMFEENRFGLCDMGGNVQEWCSTWYEASMNDADVLKEFPELKDDGGGQSLRVLRGASWDNGTEAILRSSCRYLEVPRYRVGDYGFRCVLVVAGG